VNIVNNPFQILCARRKRLVDVSGQFFPSEERRMLTAIKLDFDGTSVLLTAQSADDSIDVTFNESILDEPGYKIENLNDVEPWKNALHRPMLWAWRMINQQGYFDGLQFDFAENVEDKVTRIQLLVVASEFKICVVPER